MHGREMNEEKEWRHTRALKWDALFTSTRRMEARRQFQAWQDDYYFPIVGKSFFACRKSKVRGEELTPYDRS